ncbi:hypothetical protein GURASL_27970 [Geotalea uraniireducens]|uniref:HNH nuclease domain-containing protein n=1 Tax=Geotalea uraniireducens TaxID=351604 RepID=A0ABM8ENM0_9BACT|nr:HNH endonuclease signature motif containing protein [Geotalea uraniireducens]BDV43874.1 hypothetical protein GURASL_27970 [Geotalea uraniireducens]
MEPEYPYDLEELKQIERLLQKVPIYKEKIAELSTEIEALSRQAVKAGAFSDLQKIDKLITKAFYIDCENRPFNSCDSETIARLLAEIAWHGEIKNRNIPCEICGENRSTDRCHIVPSKLGGTAEANNILVLCPTHHRLLDRFMLSKAEWAVIDWERKSVPSQQYASSVTLEAHKVFWSKIECGGEPEKIREYEINEKSFIRNVIEQIGKLFIQGRPVKRASVYELLDPNIREVGKKVIKHLVDFELLRQIKSGNNNMLVLGPKKLEASDETVLRIWQQVA